MIVKHVRFEYDPKYQGGLGGDTASMGGHYHLVPLEIVLRLGQQAFVEATGLPAKHIVACNTDDIYDRNGNLIED